MHSEITSLLELCTFFSKINRNGFGCLLPRLNSSSFMIYTRLYIYANIHILYRYTNYFGKQILDTSLKLDRTSGRGSGGQYGIEIVKAYRGLASFLWIESSGGLCGRRSKEEN